ncbi:MAG: hydrogenase formation protein HypD [Chrysiogenetes bacterium]|nr:hydrogenase formation protein HypD [Chrysiogenetes bacterium]
MKPLDPYRDPAAVRACAEQIAAAVTRPWTIMEVCGGQTHAIVRYGLDSLLPKGLELVHGPGCPVCVTPGHVIDAAVDLAGREGVTLCSFGDMLRVPGNGGSLMDARAEGGSVEIVYSPLDALALAKENPGEDYVFLAVGFETTAPANAMAVAQAARAGVENFSILVSHVLVPPAMEAILSSPDNRVQGFLAAGHVCTVMGFEEYEPIAARHRVPIVVTGFEPLDILQGVLLCVRQLEAGEARVENQYARAVERGGNRPAQELIAEIFEVAPQHWRGIGELPASGLRLREKYARFDAARRFGLTEETDIDSAGECISGEIMRGVKKPQQCPAFGVRCTPERPLGAPMVSSEGACAAYYRHRAHPSEEPAHE